jgi:amidohydrolase
MVSVTSPITPELEARLVAWRRDFHRHPELGFAEHRSAKIIADLLRAMPGVSSVQEGVAGTGVVALIEGAHPGPCVLVRADMDGLPIQELGDRPYGSTVPQVMHACGHDGHMAMNLGVAEWLSQHRERLHGQVKLVFQPAEEGPGGAKPMIEAGVMASPKVDHCLGMHLWNSLPAGVVGLCEGPCMANTDEWSLHIQGEGGHGAMPHKSVDSVVVASAVVQALQSVVSRNVDPLERAVLTVGTLHAGDRHNVIAHTAQLTGTCRSFTPAIGELLPARIATIAEHTCKAHGATCHLEYKRVYPATINDPVQTRRAWAAIEAELGVGQVVAAAPSMGGEDMSYFLNAAPGCFLFVGSNEPQGMALAPHHHPAFDIDERALAVGVRAMLACVLDLLKGPEGA